MRGSSHWKRLFPNFLWKLIEVKEIGIILATVVVASSFMALSPAFSTAGFWSVILSLASRIGTIAAGMTLLICSREFDLSVGSVFALVPIIAFVLAEMGVDIWVGVLVGMVASVLCGLLNGFVTVRLGIPSLITTLGTMFFYRTLALVFSIGGAKSPPSDTVYRWIFGVGEIYGVSVVIIWWLAVSVFCVVILEKTRHGNWTLATGGNEAAARAVGVKTARTKILNFVLTSVLAGLAGIIYGTKLNSMYAVYGIGMELQIIGAVVIGGTSLAGGSGTVIGTLVGSTLLGIINLGIVTLVRLPGAIPSAYLFEGAVGALILLIAVLNVGLDRLRRRR